jgi:glycosyltransferase involved in cell wall biosynthesis
MLVFNTLDPDPRVWKEAESLSQNGYRVVVFAQRGRNQKKVRRIHKFIVCRPFPFHPYGLKPWNPAVVWLIFLNYVFLRRRERFAIVHCHDAETLPFGLVLSRRDGAKLVYDAHELFFAYLPTARHAPSRLRRLKYQVLRRVISFVEKRFIGRCYLVLTVNMSLSHMIQSRYGLAEPPVSLYNARKYTDVTKTCYLQQKLDIPRNGKVLFYQGAIRPDREIERIVEVLARLDKEWFLVVAGVVAPPEYLGRLRALAKGLDVADRFLYAGFLAYEQELLEATASSDVGIHLLPPTSLSHVYSLANKFFDYIMAEVPIVVNDLPEMKSIIKRYGVGVAVDLDRKDLIAEAIRKLASNREMYSAIVSRVRQAKQELCWEREEGKLLAAYERLFS